jgi:hypothetical protein
MVDWAIAASWAQAIANTVVLFLIYLQMKQVNQQMIQNDEQEKWHRSWEFVRFYREELRECDRQLEPYRASGFDATKEPIDSEIYAQFITHFYKPRIHLFVLLNQMVQHQEVDERMLFGYLADEFNSFVEMGITISSLPEFRKSFGSKMDILLTLWGSLIKSKHLLYATATPQVTAS